MRNDTECYLEFKQYGTVVRFSGLSIDMDMEDYYDLCQKLALAIGFQSETVKDWFEHE